MILSAIPPDFQIAIDEIISEISPAAIVCFGHSQSTTNHVNCFHTTSSTTHHYHLLIVQSKAATHYKDHELIDLVNKKFPEGTTVNILSHSEQSVRNALQQQHPFFTKIFKEGQILHQSDNAQFTLDIISSIDPNPDQNNLIQECQRSFDLAKNFQQLATHCITNQRHDVAVFLLHQAMEQMCIASIKAHLQYRPSSHNLSKLIDLVSCYLPKVKTVFPCNTNDEQELFGYLKRAYSDARYNPNYEVSPNISIFLSKRIIQFRHLVEAAYQQNFKTVSV